MGIEKIITNIGLENKRLIKVFVLCCLLLTSCWFSKNVSIGEESNNPYPKMLKTIEKHLERKDKKKAGIYDALNQKYYWLLTSYSNVHKNPTEGGGRAYWTYYFYRLAYFETILYTEDDSLYEGFLYVKEKDTVYHCRYYYLPPPSKTRWELEITALPYEKKHFAHSLIRNKPKNWDKHIGGTKYLVAQIRRVGKYKWLVSTRNWQKKYR